MQGKNSRKEVSIGWKERQQQQKAVSIHVRLFSPNPATASFQQRKVFVCGEEEGGVRHFQWTVTNRALVPPPSPLPKPGGWVILIPSVVLVREKVCQKT